MVFQTCVAKKIKNKIKNNASKATKSSELSTYMSCSSSVNTTLNMKILRCILSLDHFVHILLTKLEPLAQSFTEMSFLTGKMLFALHEFLFPKMCERLRVSHHIQLFFLTHS